MSIRRGITGLLSTLALALQVAACASGDINLGKRGGGLGPSAGDMQTGGGGMAAASGVGGAVAGQSVITAGASGQVAGSAGEPLAGAGSSMAGAGNSAPPPPRSSGCGLQPPAATDRSISVGSMRGNYLLDVPAGYDSNRAYPLIFALRGAAVSAQMFRDYLKLPPQVGADGIVVHPDCLNDAVTWDVQRDVRYFDDLLAKLESTFCVAQDRIFVVGHGSGGYFTSVLGCMRGEKLRAIAPLSAAPPSGMCQGKFAVWILQGNLDAALTSGREGRNFWLKRNNCDDTMPMPVSPMPCLAYPGCDAGFPVRYCEYDGNLDLPSFAAAGVWDFFKSL